METMNGVAPLPAEFKSCDTCKFGVKNPDGSVICFGVPPTPVPVGMVQDLAGRPQIRIEAIRPTLAKGQPACSLHQSSIQLLNGAR